MNLINGTSHEVILYSVEDCQPHPSKRGAFIKNGAKPVAIFQSGANLMVKKENPEPIEIDGLTLTKRGKFISADPLPGSDEIVFASNFYLAGLIALGISTEGRVATPQGPVYEDEQAVRPCGITSMEVG